MSVDIQRGKSKTVTLVPSAPMSGCAASVYDRNDEVKAASLTCTPSTINTTVATDAGNTRQQFKVSSATGFVGGRSIRVTDPTFGSAVGVVSSIDGTICRLVDPLPDTPSDGSAIVGLDVDVVVPTTATDTLYRGYVLELSGTGADNVQLVFNVVRYVYAGPCKAEDVRALIARGYAGDFQKDEVRFGRVADEVNAQIRGRLLATANYLSCYWDPDALRGVKAPMLRLVLAEQHGMREGGSSRDDYLEGLERDVRERINDVLRSAAPYDAENEGKVPDKTLKAGRVVRMVL